MKDFKQIFTPIAAIVLSITAFSLVAVWAWSNTTVQKEPNQSGNSNSTLADCGGYYLWNKAPNESQTNILTQKYDLSKLEQTAQSLGYTTGWPTELEWISLRKQAGQDTYKIDVLSVSRTDSRQRITTILTTDCDKSDSEVKTKISGALSQLNLETSWITNASVEIDFMVRIESFGDN